MFCNHQIPLQKQGRTNLITWALGQTGRKKCWRSLAAAVGRVCPHLFRPVATGGDWASTHGDKPDRDIQTKNFGAICIPLLLCHATLHSNVSFWIFSVVCPCLRIFCKHCYRLDFGNFTIIFKSHLSASVNLLQMPIPPLHAGLALAK